MNDSEITDPHLRGRSAFWIVIPIFMLSALVFYVGTISSWTFAALDYLAAQQGLFLTLNRQLSALPPGVWSNLTRLGDATVLIALISPVALYRPRILFAVFSAVPLAGLLSVVGKAITAIPRPAGVLEDLGIVVIGQSLTAHNSFPSGHAITVFAGAVAVGASLMPHPFRWLHSAYLLTGLIMASFLCLSRVAVGAHWPLDVMAGAAFGWLAGLSGAVCAERVWRLWSPLQQAWGCSIMALVIAVFSAQQVIMAMRDSSDAPVLWSAMLCGTITVCWLIRSARLIGTKKIWHPPEADGGAVTNLLR